ncbi:hypothetical protein DPEC_G00283850 [Dallia pectoralis]|uniref:Uncharacterized protein n=1 Tax=Dallia pectoralis TaxID=75939 RepID=A0ACC2FJD3_DALPE|nr:hypothetical protein DPEC_G00283850 [Dallia pectoralis]
MLREGKNRRGKREGGEREGAGGERGAGWRERGGVERGRGERECGGRESAGGIQTLEETRKQVRALRCTSTGPDWTQLCRGGAGPPGCSRKVLEPAVFLYLCRWSNADVAHAGTTGLLSLDKTKTFCYYGKKEN